MSAVCKRLSASSPGATTVVHSPPSSSEHPGATAARIKTSARFSMCASYNFFRGPTPAAYSFYDVRHGVARSHPRHRRGASVEAPSLGRKREGLAGRSARLAEEGGRQNLERRQSEGRREPG